MKFKALAFLVLLSWSSGTSDNDKGSLRNTNKKKSVKFLTLWDFAPLHPKDCDNDKKIFFAFLDKLGRSKHKIKSVKFFFLF